VDCPADFDGLARALTRIPDTTAPVWLVPGIRSKGVTAEPDVLRGEETQAFGWLTLDAARSRGRRLICHPGTHSKWLRLEDGRVTRFVSAFTGEVFDLMTRDSLLKVPAPFVDNAAAFEAGVTAAGDGGGLLTRLYAARGRIAGAGADPRTTPSFVSGVLIGSEVATVPGFIEAERGETIEVIGGARLTRLYGQVLAHYRWTERRHDGEAAALAGLTALARTLEGR
jgi:2-dehydro-3-deoxygalactonokinase